jgi:two-component system, NtrC family, sensor kinase
MKNLSIIFFTLFSTLTCLSQNLDPQVWYDSMHRELKKVTTDMDRIDIWNNLADIQKFSRADSAIYFATKALALSRLRSFNYRELKALNFLIISYNTLGNHEKSLRITLEGLRIVDALEDVQEKRIIMYKGSFQNSLGDQYYRLGDYKTSLYYLKNANEVFKSIKNPRFTSIASGAIGRTYLKLNQLDSTFYFSYEARRIADSLNLYWLQKLNHSRLGEIHQDLNNLDSSLYYYRKAISIRAGQNSWRAGESLAIAKLQFILNQPDSSIYFAEESMRIAVENRLFSNIIEASLYLSKIYAERDPVKALGYSNNALAYKDSLANLGNMTSFTDFVDFDEQQRQYEVEAAREESQSRIRMIAFLGSTFTLLVIAFFLYRNNRTKHRAKLKIEKAYDQLKSTQTQLIHSEKMASLGELTAGIAHEIQNPLNFVNNFSEVSGELASELKEELGKGDLEEVGTISDDLIQNLEKINHHGQRASSIVKGMLEHSRTGDGTKELTDINKLADEYLRLSYHGLRAKDKSFNADFKLDLDESLPKIKVVPQDIGRVLLNLINNAFQVVNGVNNPKVEISTRFRDDKIEIRVKDNGSGIPEDIKDKIFEPFFTTKPTGQGTGLGLSMSYDIITKGHGGELKVESKVARPPAGRAGTDRDDPVGRDEGSEFIVQLPINN